MDKEKIIILFDLDGTLIDSTDAIIETFYFTFKQRGFENTITKDAIKELIGYPLEVMYEKLGVEKELIDVYVADYRLRYRDISVAMTTLLPEAKEAVELAASFARLGIVTTKTARYSIPLLENLGIAHYFEAIVGREDVEHPKPDPEPIYKVCDLLGVNRIDWEIIMIGDTKLDLMAASRAQIKNIGVLCGHGSQKELEKYTKRIEKNALDAIKSIISEKTHNQ